MAVLYKTLVWQSRADQGLWALDCIGGPENFDIGTYLTRFPHERKLAINDVFKTLWYCGVIVTIVTSTSPGVSYPRPRKQILMSRLVEPTEVPSSERLRTVGFNAQGLLPPFLRMRVWERSFEPDALVCAVRPLTCRRM
jgi:hypothetical protein